MSLGLITAESVETFHTRTREHSLEIFLRAAGPAHVSTEGSQRCPLANPLPRLAKGQPGGHEQWPSLLDPEVDSAYAAMLDRLDATDTLIATATR